SVINNIFLNKENAFFNFASLMNLNVLDTKSAIKFLEGLNIDDKIFTKEAISKLDKYTKFHPFYLVKTIQESYIKALIESSNIIQSNHIDEAIDKICDDNNAYFESIWQKVNHKKYKGAIFKGYCKDKNSIKEIDMNKSYKSQLIKELREESLLFNDNTPTDPFLCIWLK
ncbi:MAG: hypothetical protein U9O56_03725, partial [Campylobacterota bacterium]|nr:hypothetical protein [Campylobacterota bacterium]